MSSSIGKARKWLAGVVAGDELPSYEKARAEMGGVPWRKLEHTDSWFLMSANSLEAQDDIDLDAPIDSQPSLDTMPAMPPIMSVPAMPAIPSAPPVPALPAAQPIVIPQQTRDALAVLSVAATAPTVSPSLPDPLPEMLPPVTDFSASLSGEPINLRTPLVSLKTALMGAAVAGFVAIIAIIAVHQPPAPMVVPQAVAAPAAKPVAPPVAAVDKTLEKKKTEQAEPRVRPPVKHPARRAHRH